jgi:HAD superfamily hydrolase (TIGR01458 family)
VPTVGPRQLATQKPHARRFEAERRRKTRVRESFACACVGERWFARRKGDRMLHGIIFDVDGVLDYQGEVCPGAIDVVASLRHSGFALRFLTNSTLHSRASRAAKLVAKGFDVSPEEVITASYATARYLEQQRPASCWVMVGGEGLSEFSAFHHDMDNPEYIVVGDYRNRFDFRHLNQALRLLLNGAKLVGMSPDLIDRSTGDPELNAGSWIRLLETAARVQAVYVGKPQPFGFGLALTDMRLRRDQVVMVGDRVDSDIKGAKRFGIRSVLVKTGEYRMGDLDGSIKPDFVVNSLRELIRLLETAPTLAGP